MLRWNVLAYSNVLTIMHSLRDGNNHCYLEFTLRVKRDFEIFAIRSAPGAVRFDASPKLFGVPLTRSGNYSNNIRPPTIRSRGIRIRVLPNIRIWGVGLKEKVRFVCAIVFSEHKNGMKGGSGFGQKSRPGRFQN